MSSNREDVFTRLSLVIEDWNAQIAHTHRELANQIGVARGHLDRLLEANGDGAQDDETSERDAAIARLEAEVADLQRDLDAVRTAPPVPGPASDIRSLEEALHQTREDLADRSAATDTLARELQEATDEVDRLTTRLRALERESPPHAGPGGDEDVATLRAALEMLQLEHAQAQDEIRTLKQALDGHTGPPPRTGTGAIDAFDARGHKKRMGEILVGLGVLTEVQLKTLLKEQSADPQQRLGSLAVAHGFIGEHLVARILAAQLRLPYQDLADVEIEASARDLVSPHVIRLHRAIPLREADGVLTVAMVNPLDLIAIEDLELASQRRVAPVVATPSDIDALLAECYPESP